MGTKLTVAVIFGGRSGEHEVSLLSARSVLSVLPADTYQVVQIGITHDGTWFSGENVLETLEKGSTQGLFRVMIKAEPGNPLLYAIENSAEGETLRPVANLDVVFPVLHGTYGEDGTLQGLLEMADLAYVGAGVLGSSVGMDKALFKDIMQNRGIPTLPFAVFTRRDIETRLDEVLDQAEGLAPYPLFVKPANLGSSVGISKVKNRSDLLEGLMEAASYDRRILVERGINAREIEVSVLGNEDPIASIPGEIRPSDEFYTYEAKYIDDRSQLIIPADIPDETGDLVRDLAMRAYTACDCAGMSRVDFLMDKETGEVFLNEMNTIPGFTKISMYPKLWEATGISYPELVKKLIELAMERKIDRSRTIHEYRREK